MNFDNWINICEFLEIKEKFQSRLISSFFKNVCEYLITHEHKIELPSNNTIQLDFYVRYFKCDLSFWTDKRVLICDPSIKLNQFEHFASSILHKFDDENLTRSWQYQTIDAKELCFTPLDNEQLIQEVCFKDNYKILHLREISKCSSSYCKTMLNDPSLKFIQLESKKFLVFKKSQL